MNMDIFPCSLSTWDISDKYGYIMEDPIANLPPYFEEWNRLAADLPGLIRHKQVRDAVGKMALLDSTRLSGYKQYRLAHVQLAYVTGAYVWQEGESGVPEKLPQQLAIPLWNVSQMLDVNPGLNHASFVQANWKLIDKAGPFEAENIRTIVSFEDSGQFDWFVGVSLQVECCVVPAIKVIPELCKDLERKDETLILAHMKLIGESINQCTDVLSKIHERLEPRVLYEIIRPNMFGWGGESNPMPDGLIYEGVSDKPIQSITSGTGVFLDAFDTLAGVRKETYDDQYIKTERAAYTVGHRKFITAVEQSIPLREYVSESSNEVLKDAMNDIIAALTAFRRYHRDIVRKYVHDASEEATLSESFKYTFNKTSSTGANGIVPITNSLVADSERAFLEK